MWRGRQVWRGRKVWGGVGGEKAGRAERLGENPALWMNVFLGEWIVSVHGDAAVWQLHSSVTYCA